MSTQTITSCDKCGATCALHYHLTVRYHSGEPSGTAEVDLCPACFTSTFRPSRDWRKPLRYNPY